MQQGFLRHGLMVAFEDFDEFKANYLEVLELLRDPQGNLNKIKGWWIISNQIFL